MAVVTHRVVNPSTANATSYVSNSFTPVEGDLLVVFVVASDSTLTTSTLTASANGITFTKVTTAVYNASSAINYCFVADQLVPATPAAMTVTFVCTADPATGATVVVESVSALTRTGLSVVRQSAVQANAAAGGTPAVTFAAAVLTENPVLGCVGNSTNPATLTPPTSFIERTDGGYINPTTGHEVATRDSGHTSATVTWGSTSATTFCTVAVELDTSAVPSGAIPRRIRVAGGAGTPSGSAQQQASRW